MTVNADQKRHPLKGLTGTILYCIVPIVVTVLSFNGVLHDSFTNWDDDRYVTGNTLIGSLALQNILRIFSPHTFVLANYQPITIFSYALNYAAGRLNPTGYILTDLLFHLLNVLLVFILIRKISGSDFIASLCALLFGIHPMHVESVAWISGRKDLLYAFFYLSASLFYLSYLKRKNGSPILRYCVACFLFVCSLLSKSSAVTLPAFLFLIDYYRARKFSIGMLIDKVPFIVSSIILGVWAIRGQQQVGAIDSTGVLSVLTRTSIACYSFMFYVVRFFMPVKLAALYPYPHSISKSLPLEYLLAPLFAAVCVGSAWYFRKSKPFIFGFGFFLVNILFILHFVPVSGAVTADRFSYLAYIGLSFIVACYIEKGIDASGLKNAKVAVTAGFLCFISLVFGYAAHERYAVWKNAETLWTDVIGKYPSASAYCNRGSELLSLHKYAAATEDLNHAIALYPGYVKAYYDAGLAYQEQNDCNRAIIYYSKTIEYDSGNAEAYNSRGIAYCMLGNYDLAIADYNQSLHLNPAYLQARINRGNAYLAERNYAQAINDYTAAIARDPAAFAQTWYNRGLAYEAAGDSLRAADDFGKACAMNLDCACRTLEALPALH